MPPTVRRAHRTPEMLPDQPPKSDPPHRRPALAWASFAASGASIAIYLLALWDTHGPSAAPMQDHVGSGIAAAGAFLVMILVMGVGLIGLALAHAARRDEPGNPFVELAMGSSMLALVVLFALAPFLA